MSGDSNWVGDPLPPGLTRDDRIGWPIVATIIVRAVPDPETGKFKGFATEYVAELPKVILAGELLNMVKDMATHFDFQDNITPRNPYESDDQEQEDGS